MATKKAKRRAPARRKPAGRNKSSGSAFPAMSDLMKAIEENFRALAAMVPTGTAKPRAKTPKRDTASRAKSAVKRAATKGKKAAKKTAKKAMPKKTAAKRSRRADKRPSATSPI